MLVERYVYLALLWIRIFGSPGFGSVLILYGSDRDLDPSIDKQKK
jgi:hypothetical protein